VAEVEEAVGDPPVDAAEVGPLLAEEETMARPLGVVPGEASTTLKLEQPSGIVRPRSIVDTPPAAAQEEYSSISLSKEA